MMDHRNDLTVAGLTDDDIATFQRVIQIIIASVAAAYDDLED
ncbi:MAG: hypothetical protein ABI832_13315 [bacterium]